MVVTCLSHREASAKDMIILLSCKSGILILTRCFDLRAGLSDDLLIPLLSPNLIVVLHATRFICLRLLQCHGMRRTPRMKHCFTHPHLGFLEVFATPIIEPTFEW